MKFQIIIFLLEQFISKEKFTHDPQCTFSSFSTKERTCHYFPLYTKYNHSSNSTILISASCTHVFFPLQLSSWVYKVKEALVITETFPIHITNSQSRNSQGRVVQHMAYISL